VEVGIAELVKQLTKLVEKAEHGTEITIKRHGKPVAKLVPVDERRRAPKFGTLKDVISITPGWDEDLPLEDWEVFQDRLPGMNRRSRASKA
jgi:prevent-host-death family protein